LKIRGDTYRKAYAKYRENRLKEIVTLKREVRELQQLVEWLCAQVMPDED
jgi:hypothetical protein